MTILSDLCRRMFIYMFSYKWFENDDEWWSWWWSEWPYITLFYYFYWNKTKKKTVFGESSWVYLGNKKKCYVLVHVMVADYLGVMKVVCVCMFITIWEWFFRIRWPVVFVCTLNIRCNKIKGFDWIFLIISIFWYFWLFCILTLDY